MKIMLIDTEMTVEDASIDDMLNFALNLISDAISLCEDDPLRNSLAVDILKNVPKAISNGYMQQYKEDE